MNINNLHDLGFKGPKFTWARGSVYERLDRAISNELWFQRYPKNSIVHLPKLNSIHRPILVLFSRGTWRNGGIKPFRFLASWLMVPDFQQVVKARWDSNICYLQVVERFVENIKVWNHEEFGHIIHKKK